MLRGPDQYVRWLIRREAHTRFGAFLSTGMNMRPAPLTDMRVFVPCFPSDEFDEWLEFQPTKISADYFTNEHANEHKKKDEGSKWSPQQ